MNKQNLEPKSHARCSLLELTANSGMLNVQGLMNQYKLIKCISEVNGCAT